MSGTGGNLNAMIFPNTCSHGMSWALPCASCGRPYQPAPTIEIGAAAFAPLARIAAALERLATVAENRHTEEQRLRAPGYPLIPGTTGASE